MVGMSLRSGMRLPVGETPPLGEENVSPNEGGEEQRGESSEDKRESPREKAGEGAQEWDEEICGSSSFAMRADRHPGEGIPSAGRGGIPSGIAERSRGVSDSRAAGSAEVATSARLSEMGGGGAIGGRGASVGGPSRRSLWEEGTRYCYTSLPKVEVPARFTGDQEIGTRLKAYVMHIHCEKFCWEQDGLDLRHFFRSLGNTLAGDVEAFLLEVRDLLLQEEERDALGRVCCDEEGWILMLRDPTERFLAELQVHFPTQTRRG
ncbi:hypothetical protein CLOP_g13995 [Closterium sp. NIES-67]|nr:hypothetical protein CLOP_g13995 [Closterium sp. NIES-67]